MGFKISKKSVIGIIIQTYKNLINQSSMKSEEGAIILSEYILI